MPDFNQIQAVSTDFQKNFKYQISLISIQLVGAEFFRANGQTHEQTDGQTEMICVPKIIVLFIAYSTELNL